MVERIPLAHLPTPLFRHDALDALVGAQVWVKRDDMTGGPEAGNKIRKLEYLLADAQARDATHIITCGGYQSNHARATAITARRLGLECVLLLRTLEASPQPTSGNAFLDALVGARIEPITPAMYGERQHHMESAAAGVRAQGGRPYVIPEGGSNGLGALGYVNAMAEVRAQLDRGEAGAPRRFDAVAHACGSGGTAAGVLMGAARYAVADRTLVLAVCDDEGYFRGRIDTIVTEARSEYGAPADANDWQVLDEYRGPAYAEASQDQLRFIVQVARSTGLVFDPVYTGKALHGLSQLPNKPERVLFLHTGGLPGLLAQADRFSGLT